MTTTTPITTPFSAQTTAAEVVAGIDLRGSRIIVTGAASGIGVETARALASTGAEVTLAVRNAETGRCVASEIAAATGNRHVLVAPLDLAEGRRSIRSLPSGTGRWTSWSTTPASWRARKPAHPRAWNFSSPLIISATSP
jgi:cation diffusion facilitator CzcD-associated flavoprotein CzcO